MSKIKYGGLDQYGTGPFEQQQFGTAGVERVKRLFDRSHGIDLEILCLRVVEAVHRLNAVGHVDGKDQHYDHNDHQQETGPDWNGEKPNVADDTTKHIVL